MVKTQICCSKPRTGFWPTIIENTSNNRGKEEKTIFLSLLFARSSTAVRGRPKRKQMHSTFLHPNALNLGHNNRSQGQRKRVRGIECVENMLALGWFYRRTFRQQFSKWWTSMIFTIIWTKSNKYIWIYCILQLVKLVVEIVSATQPVTSKPSTGSTDYSCECVSKKVRVVAGQYLYG
jgi:hypothetical protein